MADLSSPVSAAAMVTEWRPDLLTAAVLLLAGGGYIAGRLAVRRRALRWPVRRDLARAAGIALALWTTSGFLQARAGQLMWVWTVQQLLLLVVVPMVLMAGRPVALLRAAWGETSRATRLVNSQPVRIAAHPWLGPLYVPVLCGLLFFGGLGAWSLRSPAAGWGLHLLLLGVGLLIALPLLERDHTMSSLAIAAALAVGVVELLADAVPGIVLRLETHLTLTHFGVGRPAWSPSWLADQQTSGAILWTIAEVLDLPFLALVAVQWLRADAREARRVDAVLDQQAVAAAQSSGDTPAAPPVSEPWWLSDPELRRRYGGGWGS